MFLVIYLVTFLSLVYYLLTKNYSYWKSKGVPFDKPFLFFGSFYDVAVRKLHLSEKLESIYKEYKVPYVGFFAFTRPYLMVRSPDLIKKILVKDFDKFVNRTVGTNESVDPITYNTLFSAKDSNWRNMRTKLSPVFTSGKMKLMFPLMKECGENLITSLEKSNGKVIEARHATQKYTVDAISSCAFGINSNCLNNDQSEIMKMAQRLLDPRSLVRSFSIFCFFFIPQLVKLLKLQFGDPKATKYLVDTFKSALEERKKLNIVRNDLIDLLNKLKEDETVDDVYRFDDFKMAAHAITFFSAGNDATASSISFALYELAINEEIQDRLRQEVTDSFNEKGDFTYDSIQNMKYLDMVLNETQRKYPLTVFLHREAVVDYTFEETGLTIEKGTPIFIPVWGLHFDPEYFPEPEKFIPERFSDENKHNITPYTYLPFGDGPRVCIGQRFAAMTMKVCIAYLIKDFKIEIGPTTDVPIQFSRSSFLLQSKNGVQLRFTKI